MKKRALLGIGLVLTSILSATSRAELIRSSTGYPSTSLTDNDKSLAATINAGPGGGFVVTSARLDPANDVKLTELRGVGVATLSQTNVQNFDWEWDLHSSLQDAIDHPLNGDVIHAENIHLASGPTVFGTAGAAPTYLVSFDLSPYDVVLHAGTEYWSTFSAVSVTGADGFWGWVESRETGPSDIGRDNTGAWTYWSNVSGHTTGRAAQDYFAVQVPEPATFVLAALASVALCFFRRSHQK